MREIGTAKICSNRYNEFAYKKANDHCKLEDRFKKKGYFSIAYMYANLQIKTPHIKRAGAFTFM